nr:LTR retrotransposon like protein [Tanacetum cinerariifolium]
MLIVVVMFLEKTGSKFVEIEIGLSTKRKLGFVKGTIPNPAIMPVTPDNTVARAANVRNVEMWETCNNLVISWIMSYVCESIAKSVMFIGTTSEILSQLETRFSLSNGSRKYKLCKDMFGISHHGSSVSVENACAVIQQEESQKDVFNNGLPTIETTTLLSKTGGKEKYIIYGFKWHLPDKCWEKVGYPVWHHKYKNQVKYNQSKLNHKRTAGSVKSGMICLNAATSNALFYWMLDTRSTDHMTPFCRDMINVKILEILPKITLPNGDSSDITHIGQVSMVTWTYLMVYKSDAFEVIKVFFKFLELQFDTKVKCIRSDNALKFVKGPCVVYLANQGIEHQTTCVDRPQQNGMVERKHMHILEAARALRFQASMPLKFWGDCVTTATYLINRISSSVLNNKTPYEKLLNKVPDYSNFRVFDCFDVALNPLRVVDKFSPKGVPCVFIGYPAHQKGYKLYNLLTRTLFFFCFLSTLVTQQDPKGFKEAISDPGWCDAMNLRALKENGIWELIDLPSGKKDIRIHLIYKRKLKSDGYVDRKKARLVIQDNLMITGNDTSQIKLLKSQLRSKFHMKELGDLHNFLGLEVTKPDLGLFISQKKYTLEMLHEGIVSFWENSPISWKSKKQVVVSRSSAEAEYKSMTITCCEITWLISLLKDLGLKDLHHVTLHYKNQATIHITANPVSMLKPNILNWIVTIPDDLVLVVSGVVIKELRVF